MNSAAWNATQDAAKNPETWFGDGKHGEQVVYAAGTFTVGSNGDTQDFATAGGAATALEYQWTQEDKRNAE